MLTPIDISVQENGDIYAATAGGLIHLDIINEKFNFINDYDGLIDLNIKSVESDDLGRLWLGSSYPNGYLQIFDRAKGLIHKITNLNGVSELRNINIGIHKAYAVYEGLTNNDIGILEFSLDNDGLPVYNDYFNSFGLNILEIYDFKFYQDTLLYITTDKGIFAANHKHNLKSADNWVMIYEGTDAIQYLPISIQPLNDGYVVTNSELFNLYSNKNYNLFNLWPYCEMPNSEGDWVECFEHESNSLCEEYTDNGVVTNLGQCGANTTSVIKINQQFEIFG